MPKKRAGEKTQLELCFEFVSHGLPVTPTEIDAFTGAVGYSSKFICLLKKNYGCDFSTLKDGRNIISYQLLRVGRIQTQAMVHPQETKEIRELLKKLDKAEKNGEIGSYAIDPEWDSLDDQDLSFCKSKE